MVQNQRRQRRRERELIRRLRASGNPHQCLRRLLRQAYQEKKAAYRRLRHRRATHVSKSNGSAPAVCQAEENETV